MATYRVQLFWDDSSALVDVEGDVSPSADGSEYVVRLGDAFDCHRQFTMGSASWVLSREDKERAEDMLVDAARQAESDPCARCDYDKRSICMNCSRERPEPSEDRA
jgi:hypothetical protein